MARRIGLIGGMSPESTVVYYERIVHEYIRRYGDHGYPEILIYSVTFQPYIEMMRSGDWDGIARGLSDAAKALVAAGAELLGIATNSMHIVIEQVKTAVDAQFVSILDAVGAEISRRGLRRVGILGTRSTMELKPYSATLAREGIETLVPDAPDRTIIDRVIFEELIAGRIIESSKREYLRIINGLQQSGAEGIVLGCTEIPLLVRQEDSTLPLLDSTILHADALLEEALK
jgi:aspartate racemase